MATFSSSSEDPISRVVDVLPDETALHLESSQGFEDYYDIDETAEWISKGDYQRVALQFPDELLHDSVRIYRSLRSKVGSRDLYILADTSHGSCCVDEVASQHVDATAIVHYGHACMSQTYRLPVMYVFGKKQIDLDDCSEKLVNMVSEPQDHVFVVRHDVAYTHAAAKLVDKMRQYLSTEIRYSEVPNKLYPMNPDPTVSKISDGIPQAHINPTDEPQSADDESSKWTIFYIGGESLGLTNLLITHSFCDVISYDPESKTTRLESSRTNKLLMRRYAVVQKARDADVFGILVGTLGVANYLPLIKHIRAILKRAHKKSYTISVGKLNPAKLANFLEVECFVLVACPENSLIDAKDFLRPIVTPYELEIALQAEQNWTGRYILDFEKLLAEQGQFEAQNGGSEQTEDGDQPMFSLITGKYRHAKRYGDTLSTTDIDSQALVARNGDSSIARLPDSAAGHFLQTRTYRGLDMRVGEDSPSVLEQGRVGIASGYTDDH
ncbi:putative diphthamide synthesis protein-domain-containing protein [Desarmillaria tabescens]|uniref:2-(3-amino-3-carboxypropyl)histidine synthase subunit 2 n=1 Tax=Armillaria tabescens TaxID=1929756 RepID=A0AA39K439_ARMTA|nr:putative diphthamide synthesis protein-domain-containing protein [Desarmillaria tabescens]KAK0452996.1 putative diphthamide synthesis protein-domain-containing protein [Desarmillaria tabescens]